MTEPVLELCGCTSDPVTGKPLTYCDECRRELARPTPFKRAGEIAHEVVVDLVARAQGHRA